MNENRRISAGKKIERHNPDNVSYFIFCLISTASLCFSELSGPQTFDYFCVYYITVQPVMHAVITIFTGLMFGVVFFSIY